MINSSKLKKIIYFSVFIFLFLTTSSNLLTQKELSSQDLPPKYQKWLEKTLIVPKPSSPQITNLIVAPHKKDVSPSASIRAFKIGNIKLYPTSKNEFTVDENLYTFFKVSGINPGLRENGRIQYLFGKGKEPFLKKVKKISSSP